MTTTSITRAEDWDKQSIAKASSKDKKRTTKIFFALLTLPPALVIGVFSLIDLIKKLH